MSAAWIGQEQVAEVRRPAWNRGLLLLHDLSAHFAVRVRSRMSVIVGLPGCQRLRLSIGERGRALEGAGRDSRDRNKHGRILARLGRTINDLRRGGCVQT